LQRERVKSYYFLPSLIFLLVLVYASTRETSKPQPKFLQTQIDLYGIQASNYQIVAFLVFLIALGILITYELTHLDFKNPWRVRAITSKNGIILLASLLIICLCVKSHQPIFVLIVTIIVYFALRKQNLWPLKLHLLLRSMFLYSLFLRLILVFYLVFFYLIPLFIPLVTPRVDDFYSFQSHYAVTVLPGLDWIENGTALRFNYGYWLTIATYATSGVFQFLGLNRLETFQLVQLFQITALGCMLLLLRKINKQHFITYAVLLLIFITPHFNAATIWTPNQTGIRYFPFIFGLYFLYTTNRTRNVHISIYALMISLLILASPEAGITIGAGFIVYLVLATSTNASKVRLLVVVLGKLLVYCIFLLAMFVFFAKYLRGINLIDGLFEFIEQFGSGYGGITNMPHPFAALIVVISSIKIIMAFNAEPDSRTRNKNAFEAAVATMMLMWLPYYLNRMVPANLWFEYFLLFVLFASSTKNISRKLMIHKFQKLFRDTSVKLVLISLFSISFVTITHESRPLFEYYMSHIISGSYCRPPYVKITGVCITGKESQAVQEQILYLKSIDDLGGYLILSRVPVFVRSNGFNQGFPWYDTNAEVLTEENFKDVTNWIDKNGPNYILVDDAMSYSEFGKKLKIQNFDIANSLSAYDRRDNIDGWVLYKRS